MTELNLMFTLLFLIGDFMRYGSSNKLTVVITPMTLTELGTSLISS